MSRDPAKLPRGSVPTREVELPHGAIAITDLHLPSIADDRTEAFERFCDEFEGPEAFLILGDLFEVWVGRKQARLVGAERALEAIRRVSDRGVDVHVISGNRDSLLDSDLERRTGATLHLEGFIVPSGTRTTFVHGDSLCTFDRGYQRLRRVLRLGLLRWLTRYGPFALARRIGGGIRSQSETRKQFKLEGDKAIQPEAVAELARRTGAGTVVCGHAHVAVDEPGPPRHIVVGEWGTDRDTLRIDADGRITVEG